MGICAALTGGRDKPSVAVQAGSRYVRLARRRRHTKESDNTGGKERNEKLKKRTVREIRRNYNERKRMMGEERKRWGREGKGCGRNGGNHSISLGVFTCWCSDVCLCSCVLPDGLCRRPLLRGLVRFGSLGVVTDRHSRRKIGRALHDQSWRSSVDVVG